ncbi:putative glycoside hydrolase [Cohnella hongkongensis]|uniref:Glycoside hydrolase n=1 Tax=Cohnella hongkongensis TaxID=178337 RepID=A0ABV9F805_9BACL
MGKKKLLWIVMLVVFTMLSVNTSFAAVNLSENFECGQAKGWSTVSGKWCVNGGTFESQSNIPNAIAVYENGAWHSDYTYHVKMYAGSAQASSGLGAIYSYQDIHNYYELWFSPAGTTKLNKVIDGTKTTVATRSYAGGGHQSWFDVQIIRSGAKTTVKVNGTKVFNNVQQSELGRGKTGLFSSLNTAAFDDITIVPRYKDTYPKIGGMNIGGPHNFDDPGYQADLAKLDMVVLGFYESWVGDNGETKRDIVNNIKAMNPDILIGQYTIPNETVTDPADISKKDKYDKLSTEMGPNGIGDWWARDNAGNQLSSYPGAALVNLTDFVTPDHVGDRYPEWLAKRYNAIYFDPIPEFDFWYSDNAHYKPRVDADWDRDGVNDSQDDPAVRSYYRNGMARYWEQIRELQPNLPIIVNADGHGVNGEGYLREVEYKNKLEGAYFEMAMGQDWSEETWAPWETMMDSYRNLIDNTTDPHLVMFNVSGGATDYAFMRYALGSALMENGYFSYSIDGEYHGVAWFDEFDVNLGKAEDGPQRTPWSNGVYMRRFENGMALVNPKGNGTQTVNIPAGYARLSGTQDPTVNNGQPASTVTLAERDGIILVKL